MNHASSCFGLLVGFECVADPMKAWIPAQLSKKFVLPPKYYQMRRMREQTSMRHFGVSGFIYETKVYDASLIRIFTWFEHIATNGLAIQKCLEGNALQKPWNQSLCYIRFPRVSARLNIMLD